ncbi:MAG: hypothetical protein R6U89_07165 [Dehalococcoidia bacterium]
MRSIWRLLIIISAVCIIATLLPIMSGMAEADSTTHSVRNYHIVYYYPPNPPPDYILSPYWSDADVTSQYWDYTNSVRFYHTIAGTMVEQGYNKPYSIAINVQQVQYTNGYPDTWTLSSGDFTGWPTMCNADDLCHWEHNSSQRTMYKYQLEVDTHIFIAHPECYPPYVYDEPGGPIT